MLKLHDHIGDRTIMGYVWQFLNRCVEWGGLYRDIKRGIPRGASLSPLLGAFYLLDLDRRMERLDVKYFRYMDDILILAPTRWKLKKAIRVLNLTFNELKLEKRPDKTSMGRIEKGLDFLGYHFSPQGLSLAEKTVENFLEKARRIRQRGSETSKKEELSDYVKRWRRWANSGLAPSPNERESQIHRGALWDLDDCHAHCIWYLTLRLYEREPLHLRMKRLGEYTHRWAGWAEGRGLLRPRRTF